ncbi:MAG: NAD(P)/FAD-dependent oxidoreductase [Patescibacteria group bacterium]
MEEKGQKYDLIIVGAGPAGLTGALYATRYKLKVLVIGKMPGGTATEAHRVCNFPTEKDITGPELSQKMYSTATYQGAEVVMDSVDKIERSGGLFEIKTDSGKVYRSKALLAAVGTERQKLNIEGEEEFIGRGISYCATCDGMFYRDKTVAVIGGGNSATTAALYLADVAEKVYLIYRGEELKGDRVWIDNVKNNENISVLYDTELDKIKGNEKVEALEIISKKEGSKKDIRVDGVFIEIGSKPILDLFEDLDVQKDEKGYIKVGPDQKTNIDMLWAAGDITNSSNGFKQIITAAAEGAIAASDISDELRKR